jgi:hypothetical protein
MKLYSKNIRNLEELEREKRRLTKERKQLEQEDIFSIEGIMNNITNSTATTSANNDLTGASGMGTLFSISGPIVGMVVDLVKDKILTKSHSGNNTSLSSNPILQKGGSLLKDAAKEMIGGYLKWKALELTYKGVTLIVKRQKRKKVEKLAKESTPNM